MPEKMKKILLACMCILSLCVLGGCSKDDDPSSGGKVTGNVKVDENSFEVKYGYYNYDDEVGVYFFFDKDVLKYLDEDGNIQDGTEYSQLTVVYDKLISKVTDVTVYYKYSTYGEEERGYVYDYPQKDAFEYVSFSEKNGSVNISSKGIELEPYGYKPYGSCVASFSVEGKPTDLGGYEDYSRSVPMTEITDSQMRALLK